SRHFFFQAEDGIRGFHVTGVQTCALPICRGGHGPCTSAAARRAFAGIRGDRVGGGRGGTWPAGATAVTAVRQASWDRGSATVWRSEERRVGKECRTPRAPSQQA